MRWMTTMRKMGARNGGSLIIVFAAFHPAAQAAGAPLQWASLRDVALLRPSIVTLAQAVVSAEREASAKAIAGRAIHARFDGTAGAFRISLILQADLMTEDVDPTSGKVIVIEAPQSIDNLDPASRRLAHDVAGHVINLGTAVLAGDPSGYPVVDAGVEQQGNRLVYRIDVAENGRLKTIRIDFAKHSVITAAATAARSLPAD